MAKIRQSFAWWAVARHFESPEALIQTAARIGYAGVEMCPREVWQQVIDAGMKVVTIGGHQSLTDGLNRLENHDRIEREIHDNLALAQRWGIPVLIVFSGNRNGLDDVQGIENTAKGLQRVARAAEDARVTLALELLNSRVDHPDYQCDHTTWGVEVCRMVNSPRVKLLYDIYHMQIMEGDIIRTIRTHIDWIGHFHTAGNPGRNELDEHQELYYPAIMRAIAATHYDGYVGQEFAPKGDPVAALQQAFDACNV